jgi:hypothetical protein
VPTGVAEGAADGTSARWSCANGSRPGETSENKAFLGFFLGLSGTNIIKEEKKRNL